MDALVRKDLYNALLDFGKNNERVESRYLEFGDLNVFLVEDESGITRFVMNPDKKAELPVNLVDKRFLEFVNKEIDELLKSTSQQFTKICLVFGTPVISGSGIELPYNIGLVGGNVNEG